MHAPSRMLHRILLTLGGFALVGAFWQASILVFRPPRFILPTPVDVASRAIGFGMDWMPHILSTSVQALGGFALAVGLGIAIAVATTFWKSIDDLFSPVITAFQIAPKVALAPLFIVWFGIGATSKILIAFLVAFFPVLVAARTGFASTDRDYLDLARLCGMNKMQALTKIQIPACLPHIFGGVKVASTLAVIGTVIGEFVSSERGLGYLVVVANNQLDTSLALAAVIVLTGLGLGLYGLIGLVEFLVMPWRKGQEGFEVKAIW